MEINCTSHINNYRKRFCLKLKIVSATDLLYCINYSENVYSLVLLRLVGIYFFLIL